MVESSRKGEMRRMIKCMGCMKDYPAQKRECPYCGYAGKIENLSPAYQRPGTILSERYIIGKAFHQDSIGISYMGWDRLLEKKVVIKEYFPDSIAFRIDGKEIVSEPKLEKLYESGKEAFLREIENWSQIEEVNGIARVYDHMTQYGTVYYVREFVKGKTIREVLEQENPILIGQAKRWTQQLIQVLFQLQQIGVAHGNLSIDSIVVTEEEIKLINFGVRVNDNKARGILFEGNPYIPKEVYEDTQLFWQKADVYATAAIFYRMATGQTVNFLDRKIRKEKIKSPFELGIWMQPEIEKGLMGILNGDPKKKEINLTRLKQIFWAANQEVRSGNKKKEEQKSYFLLILIGVEGIIAILLAIILILMW